MNDQSNERIPLILTGLKIQWFRTNHLHQTQYSVVTKHKCRLNTNTMLREGNNTDGHILYNSTYILKKTDKMFVQWQKPLRLEEDSEGKSSWVLVISPTWYWLNECKYLVTIHRYPYNLYTFLHVCYAWLKSCFKKKCIVFLNHGAVLKLMK